VVGRRFVQRFPRIETEIESLKIGKAEIKHTEAHVLNNLDEVLYENPRRYDVLTAGDFVKQRKNHTERLYSD